MPVGVELLACGVIRLDVVLEEGVEEYPLGRFDALEQLSEVHVRGLLRGDIG